MEDATLKDTLVSDSQTDSTSTATTAAAEPVKAELDPADAEAAEIGKILLNSGWTKDKVNGLLEAPNALASIKWSLENDPKGFMQNLERANPAVAEKLYDQTTDRYMELYGKEETKDGKPDPNADLMREIKALREEVTSVRTREQAREQNQYLAATRQRLDARVDDLLGLKDVKELGLTKSQVGGLRAQLDTRLAKDPSMVQRVSNGNFVDVPQVFKGLIEEYAADKKAAAEADKTAREKAERGSFPEFQNGAEAFASIPTETFDSWDATEAGFAKALQSTGR